MANILNKIKLNIKKKYIVAASVTALAAIIAAAAVLTGFIGKDKVQPATQVRAAALKKGDLAVSVSATGTVYSSQSTNVYSNLNYPVKTVLVSVGDFVNEGDALAELDVSDLELDVAQKKASVNSSQATANQNLASAKSDLEIYRRNTENGYDSNLVNAEASIDAAELDLQNAELDVQSAELDVKNSELEVENATNNLISARRELRVARDEDDATDSELDKLRDNVNSCETAKEKAETNVEKAKSSLEKVKSNLEKARASFDKAVLNNEVTKLSSSDNLVTYENKVKSAQLNTNFDDQLIAIQKLESELGKSVITAPVSGTVTSVSAVDGGSGSGLMFIIQDTDNLKIVTNIKEYDIGTVSVGNKVTVTTDATGDREFSGTLSKIAPTSTLTATGNDATSSTDAEFESEVTVSPTGKDGIRVGMNAQLSIITKEKKDIYSVAYDAVSKARDEAVVYEAQQQEDGSFIARAVQVTTGLENDLYIEISGDGLSDGMLIISDASGITEGMIVELRGGAGKNAMNGEAPSGDSPSGGTAVRMPGMGGGGGVRIGG